MNLIGVIDLLDGSAVHARRGERDRYEPLRASAGARIDGDPLALARRYLDLGVPALYVADLDAIRGGRRQHAPIRDLAALGAPIWLDAGVSSPGAAADCIDAGARHVIVGLETLGSWADLAAIARAVGPERTAFSLDLRDGVPIVARPEMDGMAPTALAAHAVEIGAGAVIVLDLARVGSGLGPDVDLVAGVRASASVARLVAGGGVRGPDDVERLADAGCDAVLVATALHSGALIPSTTTPGPAAER